MKIERALFLALTGTISAGCYVVERPRPTPPPPPQQTVAATAAPRPVTPLVPAAPGHAATPAAPAHPIPHLDPIRPGPGVLPVPPAPGPTPTTPIPPPPAPQPTPSACLDSSAATVPACTSTCSSNPFVAQRCATYAADFDSKVATQAIGCMNALTGASACDSMQAYNCGKIALNKACSDPTVAQLCQIAATPCKVAQPDCVTMLSGLNSTGQDAVAQCVAKGCQAGLYSCIEGLTSSTEGGHH